MLSVIKIDETGSNWKLIWVINEFLVFYKYSIENKAYGLLYTLNLRFGIYAMSLFILHSTNSF